MRPRVLLSRINRIFITKDLLRVALDKFIDDAADFLFIKTKYVKVILLQQIVVLLIPAKKENKQIY